MTKNLIDEIRRLADAFGTESVVKAAEKISIEADQNTVCTIIVNEGMHHLPNRILRGEVYVYSRGPMDFSSEESLQAQLSKYAKDLIEFLSSKKWSRVFVVISGHAVACMSVKLLVFRVTHMESEDWVFDGQGNYLLSDVIVRSQLRRSNQKL